MKESNNYTSPICDQLTHALLLSSAQAAFQALTVENFSLLQDALNPLLENTILSLTSLENIIKSLVNLSTKLELTKGLFNLSSANGLETFIKQFSANSQTKPFLWMFLSNLTHNEAILKNIAQYFSTTFDSIQAMESSLNLTVNEDEEFLKLALNLSTDANFQRWLSSDFLKKLKTLLMSDSADSSSMNLLEYKLGLLRYDTAVRKNFM